MPSPYKRLSEAVDAYLTYRSARFAKTTVEQEGYVLRRFAAALGDIQLRHLRAERVTDWFYGTGGLMQAHVTRDRRSREPIKPSTHNFYRSRLASFFKFCTQRGWLRDDPLSEIQPMPEVSRVRLQPPPSLLLAMLDATPSARDRAYLAVAMNTALRSNEIVRMQVGDVDFESGSLMVRISKTHEEDSFPISADLSKELRRWLFAYSGDLGRNLRPTDHLFPTREGPRYRWHRSADGSAVRSMTAPSWRPERPMTHTERVVQKALATVGLPTKDEGTHTIRRAVARAMFDDLTTEVGYDAALRTTSAMLHHKSGATTERYLGLSSERRRRDDALRGRPFLTRMVQAEAEILPLRLTADGPPHRSSIES